MLINILRITCPLSPHGNTALWCLYLGCSVLDPRILRIAVSSWDIAFMRLLIYRLKRYHILVFFSLSLITERAFANNRNTPSHAVFSTHRGGGEHFTAAQEQITGILRNHQILSTQPAQTTGLLITSHTYLLNAINCTTQKLFLLTGSGRNGTKREAAP